MEAWKKELQTRLCEEWGLDLSDEDVEQDLERARKEGVCTVDYQGEDVTYVWDDVSVTAGIGKDPKTMRSSLMVKREC